MTAVVLALLAVLPTSVGLWVVAGNDVPTDVFEPLFPTPGATILLVAVTLVLTAMLSSWPAGIVAGRFRVTGAAIALVLAWLVAALALPLVALGLGLEVRTASVCFDTCAAMLDTAEPTAALLGLFLGMFFVAVTVVGLVIALGFAIAAILLARRHHSTSAIVCLAVAFGVMNTFAFAWADGLFLPYVCLAAGVIAWDHWLEVRARKVVAAADPEDTVAVEALAG